MRNWGSEGLSNLPHQCSVRGEYQSWCQRSAWWQQTSRPFYRIGVPPEGQRSSGSAQPCALLSLHPLLPPSISVPGSERAVTSWFLPQIPAGPAPTYFHDSVLVTEHLPWPRNSVADTVLGIQGQDRSKNLQSHFELLHSFEKYYLYFLISFQKEEIRNSCHSDDDDKLPAFETAGKVKLELISI